MKRILSMVSVLVLALVLAVPVFADGHGPNVRAVHASPDAPAVDIWVDGSPAFTNAPFTGITPYAMLTPGMHNFQIVPAGATDCPSGLAVDAAGSALWVVRPVPRRVKYHINQPAKTTMPMIKAARIGSNSAILLIVASV